MNHLFSHSDKIGTKGGKPFSTLSLDLDNEWSYRKTHGDTGWEAFPSYLETVVTRVLAFLKDRNLTITFFIVGQDAAIERNHEVLRAIAEAGHEIGNHSFHHEPWMHLYSQQQIETELSRAEEHIEHATGQRPLGFRAPGYSLSDSTLRVLAQRGYLYDASTLPNLLAPLARAYYFSTARFTPDEARQRKLLGGTLRDACRPIRPYRWKLNAHTLMEIPVTTLPLFRLPMHVSYLFCLWTLSEELALRYFKFSLFMCRLTGTPPSLLLHPTDFLGCDDTRNLSFIPGMSFESRKKLEFVSAVVSNYTKRFEVLTIRQYARKASQASDLRDVCVSGDYPDAEAYVGRF